MRLIVKPAHNFPEAQPKDIIRLNHKSYFFVFKDIIGVKLMLYRLSLFLTIVACCLAGCNTLETEQPIPYRPPTVAVPTLLPAPTPTPLPPTPTVAPPPCQDNLTFKEDLTVPDGTYVDRNVVLDKRWKVENSGTCNWDEDYRFVLVDGPAMDTNLEQALFPARSGAEVVIRLVFIAPDEPGRYRSAWQAINPKGEAFGDLIFIEIIVNNS